MSAHPAESSLRRLISYVREASRVSKDGSAAESFPRMLRRFPAWSRSLESTPLAGRHPWMTYAAIEFLERILAPQMRVFEWGAGGSTLFLAERVRELVSVEHDPEWSQSVRSAMAGVSHPSWEFVVVAPAARTGADAAADASDPFAYASQIEPYTSTSFRAYARAIDRFADASFDLVVVDGRSRTSCAMHAIPKVKRGGYLLLDDADRPRYAWVGDEMARLRWRPTSLAGPGPCLRHFRRTMAWRSPAAD